MISRFISTLFVGLMCFCLMGFSDKTIDGKSEATIQASLDAMLQDLPRNQQYALMIDFFTVAYASRADRISPYYDPYEVIVGMRPSVTISRWSRRSADAYLADGRMDDLIVGGRTRRQWSTAKSHFHFWNQYGQPMNGLSGHAIVKLAGMVKADKRIGYDDIEAEKSIPAADFRMTGTSASSADDGRMKRALANLKVERIRGFKISTRRGQKVLEADTEVTITNDTGRPIRKVDYAIHLVPKAGGETIVLNLSGPHNRKDRDAGDRKTFTSSAPVYSIVGNRDIKRRLSEYDAFGYIKAYYFADGGREDVARSHQEFQAWERLQPAQ